MVTVSADVPVTRRRAGRESNTTYRPLLRPAILVLLQEQDDHGYALMDRLGELGLGRADSAGVYRALRALEGEGSVRSWWAGAERGAPRRVYALTRHGRHQLGQALQALDHQRDVLGNLIERARGVAPRSRTSRRAPIRHAGQRVLQPA